MTQFTNAETYPDNPQEDIPTPESELDALNTEVITGVLETSAEQKVNLLNDMRAANGIELADEFDPYNAIEIAQNVEDLQERALQTLGLEIV